MSLIHPSKFFRKMYGANPHVSNCIHIIYKPVGLSHWGIGSIGRGVCIMRISEKFDGFSCSINKSTFSVKLGEQSAKRVYPTRALPKYTYERIRGLC